MNKVIWKVKLEFRILNYHPSKINEKRISSAIYNPIWVQLVGIELNKIKISESILGIKEEAEKALKMSTCIFPQMTKIQNAAIDHFNFHILVPICDAKLNIVSKAQKLE